ncbi:hypothetical protein ACHQM5_015407 [Ranunculus cassubicifolius]
MENHGCINGSLENANYSSPIPLIGLYIAAGSLLLMLIMLYDIAAAFRSYKHWLPCKHFTLNSVTLSLIAIAAKLPVDLTTAMPKPVDQLSKLTATCLICMVMGFLHPSLANNSKSECITNMVALTIFVVTVAVNMCIQMVTGVIVLFFVEHTLTIFFMLLLLYILWHSAWESNGQKLLHSHSYTHRVGETSYSFFQMLRFFYQRAFIINPQLLACRNANNFVVGGVCLFSSTILVQAAVRSLVLKRVEFCRGDSDYGWSIWTIVVSQLLTVLVACFATSLRYLSMFNYGNMNVVKRYREHKYNFVGNENRIFWSLSFLDQCKRSIIHMGLLVILFVQVLFVHPILYLRKYMGASEELPTTIYDLDDVGDPLPVKWDILKCSADVDRWLQVCKTDPWEHLNRVLSRNNIQEASELPDLGSEKLIILIKLAEVCLPKHLHEPIIHAYSESIEVIRFIFSTTSGEIDVFEKAVWEGPGFSCFFPEIFSQTPALSNQSDLERAMFILSKLCDLLQDKAMTLPLFDIFVEEVLSLVLNASSSELIPFTSVEDLKFSRIEDLAASMEQVFADFLHSVLSQFPVAVIKLLKNCPAEEFEENIKMTIKYCCQLEHLADKIQWSFPERCGSSLV